MKSVADSIAENHNDIIEYGKNITEYYTSALTSISSLSKSTLDEATNLIDRNIKSLSEGGLIGLSFNLSPTVPKSAVDAQREQYQTMEQQMQSYYDDVAKIQKAALDLEYKETLADNAKKQQELLKSLEEQKQTISNYSKDVQKIQKDTNKETSKEQKRDDKEKETETQNFSNVEQGIISGLNTWMTQNPILPLGLINQNGSRWLRMPRIMQNVFSKHHRQQHMHHPPLYLLEDFIILVV